VIDLGAPYQVPPLAVTDAGGAPANAQTVTLAITQPDGTAVDVTVANPPQLTGSYAPPLFVPTMPGRHVYRFIAQNPAAAWADVFEVADDANLISIVSLADAKNFLGIDQDDTSADAELRFWLAGMTEVLEREKNEVIVARQFTVTAEENHHPGRLRLWRLPVVSLDTLARWDGTHTWDVATDVIPPDPDTGLVKLFRGQSLRGHLNYSYTAGYRVIPYHLQQAGEVLLQHVWETQRGPGVIGGGVIGPEEAGDFKQAFMLPRKVREWLGEPRPAVA
jgi:hypothetical protein